MQNTEVETYQHTLPVCRGDTGTRTAPCCCLCQHTACLQDILSPHTPQSRQNNSHLRKREILLDDHWVWVQDTFWKCKSVTNAYLCMFTASVNYSNSRKIPYYRHVKSGFSFFIQYFNTICLWIITLNNIKHLKVNSAD